MVSDDLHSPLIDSAHESRLLHLPDIWVRKDFPPISSSRLIRVDIRDVVEFGRSFVVDIPTEFRELRQ